MRNYKSSTLDWMKRGFTDEEEMSSYLGRSSEYIRQRFYKKDKKFTIRENDAIERAVRFFDYTGERLVRFQRRTKTIKTCHTDEVCKYFALFVCDGYSPETALCAARAAAAQLHDDILPLTSLREVVFIRR